MCVFSFSCFLKAIYVLGFFAQTVAKTFCHPFATPCKNLVYMVANHSANLNKHSAKH
jgi:hypothetical protein